MPHKSCPRYYRQQNQDNPPRGILLLCGLLAAATLMMDLLTPLGVASGIPYVAVVLLALWLPGQRYLLEVAVLCTMLTLLGALFSPPGGEVWKVITNRLLILAAIWGTALFLFWHRRDERVLLRVVNGLESQVQDRAATLTATNQRLQREITERKKIERALLESEARYRSLIEDVLDSSRVGIFILDSSFRIAWMNRAMERYFGLQREALLGKDKQQLICEQLKNIFEQPETFAEKVLATYTNNTYAEHFECHVIPGAGRQERWLEHWSQPIYTGFYAGGRIEQYYDITERKKAEEQLRRQEAEISHMARLSVASEMAGALAHELNQPLTVITTYTHTCLQLLRAGAVDPNRLVGIIEKIGEQSGRAGEIIHHLRAFICKTEFRKVLVNLNDLVQEVVRLADAEAHQQGTRLRLKLAKHLPSVLADRVQLQQVILNLVRNSIEAIRDTPGEMQEITIQTSLSDPTAVKVAVSDTGPGLSPEVVNKLYQPFFTTKSTGMGLGLSLSKSIVEAHGGRLWATPHPNQGVTFYFTVPIEAKGFQEVSIADEEPLLNRETL
jgi:two-component system, LuxR family, sensor kinase FixL